MDYIKLIEIEKNKNKILYQYEISDNLKRYFTRYDFFIEYPENIENVPDGVAAIPFVCNVLPIIWLTNSHLIINELDNNFLECISKIKQGYVDMYPDANFLGNIFVKNAIDYSYTPSEKCSVFFSGGLDSYATLISHLDEKPILVSIWGSDVEVSNIDGWKKVEKLLNETSKKYDLNKCIIRSSFREFDLEGRLENTFKSFLNDGWWHGVKHGIGLIGHVAPYAWLHRIKYQYIASSNCPSDGKVTCASHPSIDNQVRFCSCQVVHDGFEMSRQDKIKHIIKYSHQTNDYLQLRVCWKSKKGNNCCNCEKCFRTIMGFFVEGEDPKKYGFEYTSDIFSKIKYFTLVDGDLNIRQWIHIQRAALKNKHKLKQTKYYYQIKWFFKIDITHPKRNIYNLLYKLKHIILR